ncbi:Lrp/AsnC family transcriptional regulator [Marinicella sp. W31]|uniref:Lrp/AsnC family transcriptional regulator n=1 Tax=Marinicella sp. W31 TaxID=3023713 RepID=UPI0037565FEE
MQKLDSFDYKILAILQEKARINFEKIGSDIGLSSASVHRRIRKLKEIGVIKNDVSILDGEKLGYSMTMIIGIKLERERYDLLHDFEKKIAAIPEVQQCYYVTGDVDFILITKVRNLKHYEKLTKAAFFDHSNVKNFTTNVVLRDIKVGLTLPLNSL